MENAKQAEIHEKGFDMTTTSVNDYGRVKIGVKTLEDAILNLGSLKTVKKRLGDKNLVLQALANNDIETIRAISNFFYRTDGIYQKVCNYAAFMYRYDWYVVPEIYDDNIEETKVIKDFTKLLTYLDNSYVKKTCNDIGLQVIINGAYYAYIIDNGDSISLQELPAKYCRSRYSVNGMPVIEFNMRFFIDQFPDVGYRMKILKMFPAEFYKGYILYRQGKLPPAEGDFSGLNGWYVLEPGSAIKFAFNNGDLPLFANAIPALIDLDAAQDLDRRKQMQQLLKIIVQKLPLDKNNDLIFDLDEAKDIHNNAVEMLSRAVGVDILTTFTDVDAIDLSDAAAAVTNDNLEKMERTVYNSMGVTQNLFNASGNLSVNTSVANDAGTLSYLLHQFTTFFDKIVYWKSASKKKYRFRFYMLETTQYNYKELAGIYKEQVQIGYSKMLPQIALGHSQSSILNSAKFENEILYLSEIMIPPLMSSTMSAQDILGKSNSNSGTNSNSNTSSNNQGGRPEKPDEEKSDKTLANRESLGG